MNYDSILHHFILPWHKHCSVVNTKCNIKTKREKKRVPCNCINIKEINYELKSSSPCLIKHNSMSWSWS
jgi:hypothetical protein